MDIGMIPLYLISPVQDCTTGWHVIPVACIARQTLKMLGWSAEVSHLNPRQRRYQLIDGTDRYTFSRTREESVVLNFTSQKYKYTYEYGWRMFVVLQR